MEGGSKPSQGLRLNQEKKYQILRAFQDDDAGCYTVYGKKVVYSLCFINYIHVDYAYIYVIFKWFFSKCMPIYFIYCSRTILIK